ncbi:MAG TPA: HlyD family efflux transporter periplasmic adaptor subunit [Sphingomonas sp.]
MAGAAGWYVLHRDGLGRGIASGNGRIEATEIDIAAKTPGRIREILVDEGDEVKAGQVLATIDTDSLVAQREQFQAQAQQAVTGVVTAEMEVAQQIAQHAAAVAQQTQREADYGAAQRHLARSTTLAREGATPQQERDDDVARVEGAKAMVEAARAQVSALAATIATARSQVAGARSSVEAAHAAIRRIDADISDAVLRAPRDGRIQYRIAQPGEVVGAGGRVLNMVDLNDVTMTFFLPEIAVGRVGMGDEARLILDTAPDRVIPARISFVADVAQFTPKTVETKDERQKLMFRVKARIAPALLARYRAQVKSGIPGMAYVRIDRTLPWPARLSIAPPR